LLSPNTREKSFSAAFLGRIMVNMTSCSELEEETDEEGATEENFLTETDKAVATLEAMPIC